MYVHTLYPYHFFWTELYTTLLCSLILNRISTGIYIRFHFFVFFLRTCYFVFGCLHSNGLGYSVKRGEKRSTIQWRGKLNYAEASQIHSVSQYNHFGYIVYVDKGM